MKKSTFTTVQPTYAYNYKTKAVSNFSLFEVEVNNISYGTFVLGVARLLLHGIF